MWSRPVRNGSRRHGLLTWQIHSACYNNDGSSHQWDHRQQLRHAAQTSRSIDVPLLQTVTGLDAKTWRWDLTSFLFSRTLLDFITRTYHDWVNKSHDVDWPDGAEARDDGEDEVVFGFGTVQGRIGGDTGVAWNWRTWRKGSVGDGAGPAAHPRAAHGRMVRVRQRMMPARRRGHDGSGGKTIGRARKNPTPCQKKDVAFSFNKDYNVTSYVMCTFIHYKSEHCSQPHQANVIWQNPGQQALETNFN